MTTSIEAARQLTLSWGVIPAVGEVTSDEQVLGHDLRRQLAAHRLARTGDRLVITAGLPLGESDATNAIRVAVLD
jgi:pyruvate kinase